MGILKISGQGSLEYLLLIGGAILVGAIVFSLAVSTTQEGGIILSNNLGGVPSFHADIPEKSLGGDPVVISFTVSPTSNPCEVKVEYIAGDDDTSPVDLFVRMAVSPSESAISLLSIDDFDSPVPIPNVEFQTFIGSIVYTPPVCGTNYYELRICDLGFKCSLSEIISS